MIAQGSISTRRERVRNAAASGGPEGASPRDVASNPRGDGKN